MAMKILNMMTTTLITGSFRMNVMYPYQKDPKRILEDKGGGNVSVYMSHFDI